jgi:transposase
MDLTDQQWTIIEPLFEEKRRPDGRGRPWRDARAVLNGVLWVLRTGASWHDLPDRYPPYQTCHRRFQQWRKNGVFRDLLTCLAEDLRLRGKIDLTEGFIDASFTAAKKGTLSSVLQSAAGSKIMAIVDRRSLPLAVHVVRLHPLVSRRA